MHIREILSEIESLGDRDRAQGMARYGITGNKVYGVPIPALRKLAKKIGGSHDLAAALWDIDSRETRILASMIDTPETLTEEQMDRWVHDFDSWEICDQCIMNLFEKHTLAWDKAQEWSHSDDEFVKRAGFAVMARLAGSDKNAADEKFMAFFPLIEREATDGRNFVKKAVNWALRQIGKRNARLNTEATACAHRLLGLDSKSARWIARDALREIESEKVRSQLRS